MHPYADEYCFGEIPEISHTRYNIPGGEVFLRYGKHNPANNRGFGLTHIWERHSSELEAMGYCELFDAAKYVADIIQPKAKIFYEFAATRNEKVTVFQNALGVAVVEYRLDGDNVGKYSVITAYKPRRIHGTQIGVLT